MLCPETYAYSMIISDNTSVPSPPYHTCKGGSPMKITCPYCGTLFDDTKTHCPSCGAVNSAVVRTTSDQPLTIAQLQQWYKDRGLPPYKTTRFFIGEDYRGARAFGIYKDTKTGNFVVYKNKDNGKRAVRYEGTDEAYAVNELYQRLKQEIIQQKQHNIRKKGNAAASGSSKKPRRRSRSKSLLRSLLHTIFLSVRITLISVVGSFVLLLVIGFVIDFVEDTPKDGYYRFDDTVYCHYTHSEPTGKTEWFLYDEDQQEWSQQIADSDLPSELERNKQAKNYFLSAEVPEELAGRSFEESLVFADINAGAVHSGYYSYAETTYYYLGSGSYSDWYYFDSDDYAWYESTDLPEELTHSSIAEDFYYTPVWNSYTQLTDFQETSYYQEYEEALEQEKADKDRWENDNDDHDFDWGGDDTWDAGDTDWDSDW